MRSQDRMKTINKSSCVTLNFIKIEERLLIQSTIDRQIIKIVYIDKLVLPCTWPRIARWRFLSDVPYALVTSWSRSERDNSMDRSISHSAYAKEKIVDRKAKGRHGTTHHICSAGQEPWWAFSMVCKDSITSKVYRKCSSGFLACLGATRDYFIDSITWRGF